MATLEPHEEFDHYRPPAASLDRDEVGPRKTQGIDLSVDNPFLTIWTRPRATIRAIVDKDPAYLVVPLAMAAGVVGTLDRAAQQNLGDQLPLAGILALATVLGPISGVIGLYISAGMLGWSGRMLGGRGEWEELKAAMAWGQVPAIASILILLIQHALIGREVFTSEKPSLAANPGLAIGVMGTGVIEILATSRAGVLLFGLGQGPHRLLGLQRRGDPVSAVVDLATIWARVVCLVETSMQIRTFEIRIHSREGR